MTDHPTIDDYRNRLERAEAECKELRDVLDDIAEFSNDAFIVEWAKFRKTPLGS